MRLMLAGDTHGFESEITRLAAYAGERKISHLVILGDFGLWTHRLDGIQFLDVCQRVAEGNKLSIFAVPGNHENHNHWEAFTNMGLPTHKGATYVRERVLLFPKVHSFTMANKNFLVAGGAVSVDKQDRLKRERGGEDPWMPGRRVSGSGPRTLYWPNETLTDEDEARAIALGKRNQPDYFLTHDCSDHTLWDGRLKPDLDSKMHRQRIDRIIKATRPKMHFHGHMHTKYDWRNSVSHGYWPGETAEEGYFETQTYGLQCNEEAQYGFTGDNWGVLDTETNEFAFQGKGMNFRSLES
jgi:predicted phosphodiesterase